MKKAQRHLPIFLMAAVLVMGIIASLIYFYYKEHDDIQLQAPEDSLPELISLSIYIQNKEIAETSDCSVTQKVIYQVPKTLTLADASLKILFKEELSQYGEYKSIVITDGVARISLQKDTTPSGSPISSLSSCQVGHLISVLYDTLTQYESIQSIELFTPAGKVEF